MTSIAPDAISQDTNGQDTTPRKVSRRRDAAATQAAILDAGRTLFAQFGYDGVGVRDIANAAGVTAALINRYFGSKLGLFAVAVPPTLQIAIMLDGDMRHFGERAAAIMVNKSSNAYDPMMALLRSAGCPSVAPLLRDAVQDHAITPLATRLSGPHRRMRASLIIAQLAGFDVMMRALAIEHLAIDPQPASSADSARSGANADQLRRQLASGLQALVDDPL